MINKFNNLSLGKKIGLCFSLFMLLMFVIAVPSFCNVLLSNTAPNVIFWDGTSASGFASDSTADTLYIDTPSQFAYFRDMVSDSRYSFKDKTIIIRDDIYLNEGVFDYDGTNLYYIKNSTKYYLKPNTNEYYSKSDFLEEHLVGTINVFEPFDWKFEGTLKSSNDESNSIFGLYIIGQSETDYRVNLFNDFNGELSNVNFFNTLIYGGRNTGIVYIDGDSVSIDHVYFNGNIIGSSINSWNENIEENSITFNDRNSYIYTFNEYNLIDHVDIVGTVSSPIGFKINNEDVIVNGGSFSATVGNSLVFSTLDTNDVNVSFTAKVHYKFQNCSGFISGLRVDDSALLEYITVNGNIVSINKAAGLIGEYVYGDVTIENVVNKANVYVNSEEDNTYAGGFISYLKTLNNYENLILKNSINYGNISGASKVSGFIGYTPASAPSNIIFQNNVNASLTNPTNDIFIGNSYDNFMPVSDEDINNNFSIVGTNPTSSEKSTLISIFSSHSLDEWNVYNNSSTQLPVLKNDYNLKPQFSIKFGDNTYSSINVNGFDLVPNGGAVTLDYSNVAVNILKAEYYIDKNSTKTNYDYDFAWKLYNDNINITENGYYTIFAKITDIYGNYSIVSTPKLFLDNYSMEVKGVNNENLESYDYQITNKSSIKYNFNKELCSDNYLYFSFSSQISPEHYIKSSYLFKPGTIIKIIDKINSKYYIYEVSEEDYNSTEANSIASLYNSSCSGSNCEKFAIYPLSVFHDQGKSTVSFYSSSNYAGGYNTCEEENFDVIIDFSNSQMADNVDLNISFGRKDGVKYNSISNRQQLVKVLSNVDSQDAESTMSLNLSYDGTLNLSQVGSKVVSFTQSVTSISNNGYNIYSDYYNSLNYKAEIRLTDSSNNDVNSNAINAISIDYNDAQYYASNGVIIIPLGDITGSSSSFEIKVNSPINELINGTYFLKIKVKSMSSGIEMDAIDEASIIASVNNSSTLADYYFEANIDNNERIIVKSEQKNLNNTNKINCIFDYVGSFNNPNIHVSLYKKYNYTSTNQQYEMVDLNSYVANSLQTTSTTGIYKIATNLESGVSLTSQLDLVINSFSLGGYKLVFELYDGNSYIGKVEKTFIVK